jgi:hypothetical protein
VPGSPPDGSGSGVSLEQWQVKASASSKLTEGNERIFMG